MTLIDALAALQEGAVPTNEQTIAFLQRIQSSLPERDGLSKPGSKLLGNGLSVLEAVELLVTERNTGEEIQEFLWRTQGTAKGVRKDGFKLKFGGAKKSSDGEEKVKGKKKPKDKVKGVGAAVKGDSVQAGKHLRNLARLLFVQPELRHIAADLGYVLADVVDKTAGYSLDEARDHLGQARSATGTIQNVAKQALLQARAQKEVLVKGAKEENESVARKLSELPNVAVLKEQLSSALKDGNVDIDAIRNELKNGQTVPLLDQLRQQAIASAGMVAKGEKELDAMRKEIDQGKVPAKVLQALEKEQGEGETSDETQTNGQAEPTTDGLEASVNATDLVDALQMLLVANKKTHLRPSKETMQELKAKTMADAKVNLKESFNEDVQQRLLARTKKLLVDCQSSKDYQEALLWFIERIEALFLLVQRHAEMPTSSLDAALSHNAEPLIQLVENFTGGQSVRELLELARQLSIGAKDDPEVLSFWQDADAYIRKCLLEEGYVLTEEADAEWHKFVERVKGMQQAYKDKLSLFVQGLSNVINAIRKDELVIGLLKSLEKLVAGLKGEGWKAGSIWHDLRHKILPPLFDKFGVIPVPRIKYTHPEFDLVIENIALQLTTLLPDTLDLKMTNEVHFDFHRIKDSTHAHQFKLKIKGMSLRVHELAFAFTSRAGFTFHDRGIADLLIQNFGVSIYLDVPKDPGPHFFLVRKVKAKLGKLQFRVHKSNHQILHFLADKLANSYLTKRILRHFIGVGITLGLKQLDLQLMALKLGRDGQKGDVTMADVKRQMAELRDLLKKYHEQAGSIEIDFSRDDSLTGATLSEKAKAAGESIEKSHAVRWVKKQVEETGRKEIVRNEWRSNAFDLDGMDTIVAQAPAQIQDEVAEVATKPEGMTNDATVDKAQAELKATEEEEGKAREAVQQPENMESSTGQAAVAQDNDRSKQAGKLEKAVDGH